jgi:ubiquinone/menaquinone biosynthesis C-methylase UbiE
MAGGNRIVYAKYKTNYISSSVPDKGSVKVLDFGCGDGTSLELLRITNPQWLLYGVDISAESIDIAGSKHIGNCEFTLFDGIQIPYQNNLFSVIFAANVMHHIPFEHHEKVFQEIHRVLSPGGQLFIFEHNPFNPVTRKIFKDCIFDRDANMLKPGYLSKILLKCGFLNVKISFHLFFPRHRFFSPFFRMESLLSWLPLGGQYCAWFTKK